MNNQYDEFQLRHVAETNLAQSGFTDRRVTPTRRIIPTLRLVESRRATETRRTTVARPDSVPRRLTAARRTTAARRVTDRRASDSRPVDVLLHELQVHQIELEMQNEQLRQSQLELENSREHYVDFYDFAPVGYLTLSAKGLISEINLTGAAMIGVERSKLLNQRFSQFINPEYLDRMYRHLLHAIGTDETQSFELALQRQDGSHIFVQLDCMGLSKSSQTPILRVVLTDISERIRREEEIRKLAFYDALTKLPNRRLLDDRMEQAMAASKRSGQYAALMFLDLDNFKQINDTHGHGMGDRLLMEVAHRLTSCVRGMDTVARFGGDEFVVLLRELDTDKAVSRTQADIVADKILTILAEPYRLTLHLAEPTEVTVEHHCTASIGILLFINHETSSEDIIKHADRAMFQAKEAGRNMIHFFDPDNGLMTNNGDHGPTL